MSSGSLLEREKYEVYTEAGSFTTPICRIKLWQVDFGLILYDRVAYRFDWWQRNALPHGVLE